MKGITDIGTLQVQHSQHELWKDGVLAYEWARGLPELKEFFDADFFLFYRNQGVYLRLGYGFFETLAAIVLYHATGYLPMFPTYNFEFPPSKQAIVQKLLPADVLAVIKDQTEFGQTQAPDLLMYRRDHPDWFFCEVKGPGDRLGRNRRGSSKPLLK